jgi:Phage integrase, N-terminal SAM-like domain
MDIQQAIQDYLTFHEIENSSAYTIENHRKQLGYFSAWLQSAYGITDTDGIQLAHLRGWMGHLQKTPANHGRRCRLTHKSVLAQTGRCGSTPGGSGWMTLLVEGLPTLRVCTALDQRQRSGVRLMLVLALVLRLRALKAHFGITRSNR